MNILDSKPASRLSISIVLDKKGKHVATARTLYPADGAGRVVCEVQNWAEGIEMCAKAPHCWKMIEGTKISDYQEFARARFGLQRGAAHGYGYDKKTAAMAGLIVAGHTLADECGNVPEDEAKRVRLLAARKRNPGAHDYADWRSKAEKIGAAWANGGASLYFTAGLRRLESFGFRIIEAL